MNVITTRPVRFWGIVTALIEALIGVLTVFNVIAWTSAQLGAVMLFVAAVGTGLTFMVERQVTPLADPRNNEGQKLTAK